MAGHSKWSQIKRKKGANDVKRGQLFSKLGKEIQVAARLGGGDANLNARLRSAIAAAKAESMPNDNIERAILKGTGELDGGNTIEELVYEGYGPEGIAILVEVFSDNKNRAAADIRSIFSKNNGNLGAPGSVAWMFERKAYFFFEKGNEEELFEATVDAGADDIQADDSGGVEIFAPVEAFDKVESALKVLKLIETLDDHDDVQNVYSTLKFSEELLAAQEG